MKQAAAINDYITWMMFEMQQTAENNSCCQNDNERTKLRCLPGCHVCLAGQYILSCQTHLSHLRVISCFNNINKHFVRGSQRDVTDKSGSRVLYRQQV